MATDKQVAMVKELLSQDRIDKCKPFIPALYAVYSVSMNSAILIHQMFVII